MFTLPPALLPFFKLSHHPSSNTDLLSSNGDQGEVWNEIEKELKLLDEEYERYLDVKVAKGLMDRRVDALQHVQKELDQLGIPQTHQSRGNLLPFF